MTKKILLFGTAFFMLAASPTGSSLPIWGGGPAFAANVLTMTRVAARTERRQSTMEQRGELILDDASAFFEAVTTNGISVGFYYTSTVEAASDDYPMGSPDFTAGDLMERTNFSFDAEDCWTKGTDNKVLKCKDRARKSYLFLKYKKKTNSYQMKTYIRKITCDLDPADCTNPGSGLTIDPNVGKWIDFTMTYTPTGGGGDETITGRMKRCDWKRGKGRASDGSTVVNHVKCPTLCGGSPKAVCGTEFCQDDLGNDVPACRD